MIVGLSVRFSDITNVTDVTGVVTMYIVVSGMVVMVLSVIRNRYVAY